MDKRITRDVAYRQSLMKYAAKYGVSRASRKYNRSRSYIYCWRRRWAGSVASEIPDAMEFPHGKQNPDELR